MVYVVYIRDIDVVRILGWTFIISSSYEDVLSSMVELELTFSFDIGDFSKKNKKNPRRMNGGSLYMLPYLLFLYAYLLQKNKNKRKKDKIQEVKE